jgi:hypothetical protein
VRLARQYSSTSLKGGSWDGKEENMKPSLTLGGLDYCGHPPEIALHERASVVVGCGCDSGSDSVRDPSSERPVFPGLRGLAAYKGAYRGFFQPSQRNLLLKARALLRLSLLPYKLTTPASAGQSITTMSLQQAGGGIASW